MKREIKANGLTHKLPLTHETQFTFTTQEECNLTSFLTHELRACVRASCRYDVENGTRSVACSIGRFL